MTPEELKAIEERARKATGGPWAVEASGDTDYAFYVCAAYPDDPYSASNDHVIGGMATHEDAAFAVYARTDIPLLLAEVRRLRNNLEVECITNAALAEAVEQLDDELRLLRAEIKAVAAR